MKAPALPRRLLAATLLIAPLACPAQALEDLETLPLTIAPSQLLQADGGGRYDLLAYLGHDGQSYIDRDGQYPLKAVPSPHAVSGYRRFLMTVKTSDAQAAELMISLIATRRRCMLTTISPDLDQGSISGRKILLVPRLTPSDRARLSINGSTHTLCAPDDGRMTLVFSPPSFDMLQLALVGSRAAAQFVMLPLPTLSSNLQLKPGRS